MVIGCRRFKRGACPAAHEPVLQSAPGHGASAPTGSWLIPLGGAAMALLAEPGLRLGQTSISASSMTIRRRTTPCPADPDLTTQVFLVGC